MPWESTEWSCGHNGDMQLYRKATGSLTRAANTTKRKCVACWLVERWMAKSDPRAKNAKRWELAKAIAENRGIRIYGEEVLPQHN